MARPRTGAPAGPLTDRIADSRTRTWVTAAEEVDIRALVAAAVDLDDTDPAIRALHERYGLSDYDCWGPNPQDMAVGSLVGHRRRDACRAAAGSPRAAYALAERVGLGWC